MFGHAQSCHTTRDQTDAKSMCTGRMTVTASSALRVCHPGNLREEREKREREEAARAAARKKWGILMTSGSWTLNSACWTVWAAQSALTCVNKTCRRPNSKLIHLHIYIHFPDRSILHPVSAITDGTVWLQVSPNWLRLAAKELRKMFR